MGTSKTEKHVNIANPMKWKPVEPLKPQQPNPAQQGSRLTKPNESFQPPPKLATSPIKKATKRLPKDGGPISIFYPSFIFHPSFFFYVYFHLFCVLSHLFLMMIKTVIKTCYLTFF